MAAPLHSVMEDILMMVGRALSTLPAELLNRLEDDLQPNAREIAAFFIRFRWFSGNESNVQDQKERIAFTSDVIVEIVSKDFVINGMMNSIKSNEKLSMK
ncbi:hypothetical protein Droror1_Dr00019707 [Drosera rotundifolia]